MGKNTTTRKLRQAKAQCKKKAREKRKAEAVRKARREGA